MKTIESMKSRKTNIQDTEASSGGCCGTTTTASSKANSCCEQPADGSACCDKSESKEVNAVKTGCC